MKKIISLLLAFMLSITIVGCANESAAQNTEQKQQTEAKENIEVEQEQEEEQNTDISKPLDVRNNDAVYQFINETYNNYYSREDFDMWKAFYFDITEDGNDEVIFTTTYGDGKLKQAIFITGDEGEYKIIPSNIDFGKYENDVDYRDGFICITRKSGGSGISLTLMSIYIYDEKGVKFTGTDIVIEDVVAIPDGNGINGHEITGEIEGKISAFVYTKTKEEYATGKISVIEKTKYTYNADEKLFETKAMEIPANNNANNTTKDTGEVIVDYEEFFNIKDSIIKSIFNIEKGTAEEVEFDLNKDGKNDIITLKFNYEGEGVIHINNSEVSNFFLSPVDVYLVDLIENDEFIEIAVLDEGASADPYTTFYRYNGESIEQISGGFNTDITSEDSVNVYYGQVLTNGKGMFIAPEDIVQFVSPKIIKAYRTLKDNKFIYHPLDYSEALNKEYTIASEFDAFFVKEGTDSGYGDPDDAVKFHEGEKIKINTITNPISDSGWYDIDLEDGTTIKIDPFSRYGIELEDGRKGELYFWMGD